LALFRRQDEQQGKLCRIFELPARALLGLHHKSPTPVKVDVASRLGFGVNEGDRLFKAVIVVL